MASQVPYQPVPDVQPQDRGVSPVHVDTPVAAFGGATAGAITHMGEVVEGAGKEIFARAYAMQYLHQQDISNKGIADFENEATQKQLEYSKNQGQDAIDKYPQFQKDLEDIRQKYAETMPSPEATQNFNQGSRSAQFRVMFSAGNYAREEMKRFSQESAALRRDAAGDNLAATMPGDPAARKQALDGIAASAGQSASEKGFHPGTPDYDQAVNVEVSKQNSKSILELMHSEPLKAQKMAQDELKAGRLTPSDSARLAPMLERAVTYQGARATGTKILSGELGDWGSSAVPDGRAMTVLPKVAGTGGYNIVGKEDPNGNGHPVGQYGVPSTELPRWLADAGMPAMSEEDFLKDKKAQDQLAQTKFAEFQKKYGSFDEALKAWSSGIDVDNRLKAAHKALADTASRTELNDTADRVASKLQPDNPEFVYGTKNHVIGEKERTDAFLARDKFDTGNVVYNALVGANSKDGKVPTSEPELLADPKVRDAYDKLGDKERKAVHEALIKNINAGGYAPTEEGKSQFELLQAIGTNPGAATPDQRQKLIDTDPANLPIPLKDRQTIQKLRAKMMDEAVANPAMGHAMQQMAPILESYGITQKADPDRYMKFYGALHEALVGYGEGASRAVKSDDEIKAIGSQLLQTRAKGWFSDTKDFEAPEMPPKQKQQLLDSFTQSYGRAPTEQEQNDINNAVLRLRYKLLHGGLVPNKTPSRVGGQ